MTCSLVFHFEDNQASIQSGRDIDFQVWRNLVYSFNIDSYFCIDCTECGIRHEDLNKNFKLYKSLSSFQEDHKDLNFIYLFPEKSVPKEYSFTNLKDFNHPNDACYIVGKDSSGFNNNLNLINKDNKIITIENQSSSLYAHIAAGIVLYDRYSKMVI